MAGLFREEKEKSKHTVRARKPAQIPPHTPAQERVRSPLQFGGEILIGTFFHQVLDRFGTDQFAKGFELV